jgi:hypothetical protein
MDAILDFLPNGALQNEENCTVELLTPETLGANTEIKFLSRRIVEFQPFTLQIAAGQAIGLT